MQYIPISEVHRRKNTFDYRLFIPESYPLFESYKDIYNYDNLRHSVYKWDLYSNNAEKNINQVLSLLEMAFEKGTDYEQEELVQMIGEQVIHKLPSPVIFKKILNRHNLNEDSKKVLTEMANKDIECDRVLENHSLVSKRFNIDKYISRNIIFEDAFTETVYTLCSLIDTYNMDMKAKFATSAELALYCINESGTNIPQKKILETVIDYFAIYHKDNDMQKFADNIYTATKKDPFIQDSIVENYLNYLMDVNDKITEELYNFDEEIVKKYNDENVHIDEACALLDGSLRSLCELAFLDKAKEIITKIKLAPVKSVNTLKEAIRALLVPTRLQDIKDGTKNALSLIFYAAITVAFVPITPAASLLGAACSFILAKHMDKQYLKDAMVEWREHKYAVERRIKDTSDPDKKQKLEQYLAEIEKNIEILEKEYEKQRDRTVDELRNEQERRVASPDYKIKSFQVDPQGKEIQAKSSSEIFNKVKSTGTIDDDD